MKTLIVLAILSYGCAAINQERYHGNATDLVLTESTLTQYSPTIGSDYWGGKVLKRLTISNPKDTFVTVSLACHSIGQGDMEFIIPPHTTQFALIESTRFYSNDNPSCIILTE